MTWRDLVAGGRPDLVLPYLGGHVVVDAHTGRSWRTREMEVGWHRLRDLGRSAEPIAPADPEAPAVAHALTDLPIRSGYLLGDRLVPLRETAGDLATLPTVWLVRPGLPRFSLVDVVRWDGRLLFLREGFDDGPVEDVRVAYEDRRDESVLDDLVGLPPALRRAFRWESEVRAGIERRAVEEARRAVEEREAEERRIRLEAATAERDRRLEELRAARAARGAAVRPRLLDVLSSMGAELLDVHDDYEPEHVVVRYRVEERRFESVVHRETLGVVDAGICLAGGDDALTLRALIPVIRVAIQTGALVVTRHL